MLETQFIEIVSLIKKSRTNAIKAVNKGLIDLYWRIGEYIDKRISNAEWGQSILKQLADYLQLNEPHLKGFSDKNLWRMRHFSQNYKDASKLSSLVTEIYPSAEKAFEDSYIFEFLNLSNNYTESELQRNLIEEMKNFILELRRQRQRSGGICFEQKFITHHGFRISNSTSR